MRKEYVPLSSSPSSKTLTCIAVSRLCDYSDPPPTPSSDSIMELQSKIAQLEERLSLSEHKTTAPDCLEVPKINSSTGYPSPPSRFCSTPSSSSPANHSSRHSSVSPQPPVDPGYSQTSHHITPSPFMQTSYDLHHSVMPGPYHNGFPVSLFLDTRLFKEIGPRGPRITYDVPPVSFDRFLLLFTTTLDSTYTASELRLTLSSRY